MCSIEKINVEFGLDSFSTTHACNALDLLVPGVIRDVLNLGIDGIGWTSSVAKLGSIKLEIMDDSGERNMILLMNVACIPSCPKNMISIS